MKKLKKVVSVLLAVCLMASCLVACGGNSGSKDSTGSADASGSGKHAAFVTFGLGGDFFQALADTFVSTFEAAGWEAEYADGNFDPTTQIEAAENYIAMGVDVLYIWSVAPEAMTSVVESAQAAGIKVVAFVAQIDTADAIMLSDDADLAKNACKLVASWVDEQYADAADGSVNVAVFSERDADTGVIQADEFLKIADYSKKIGDVTEVACTAESADEGQAKAETLYAQDGDKYKVFVTAHSAIADGINSYFTSQASPVTDYTGMGIFCINGQTAEAEYIQDQNSPFRGMVLTGSVQDTANEMLDVANGIMDGSLKKGYVQKAGTVFVNEETVAEYLSSGTVTSLTADDFK